MGNKILILDICTSLIEPSTSTSNLSIRHHYIDRHLCWHRAIGPLHDISTLITSMYKYVESLVLNCAKYQYIIRFENASIHRIMKKQ